MQEKKERFSKKRQAILTCLCAAKSHPTAERIYRELHESYPDLSLATVYRNLRKLTEDGVIRSVGVIDGKEHFDADTGAHSHLHCTRCGRILDIAAVCPISAGELAELEKKTGCRIAEAVLQFDGLCPDCAADADTEKGYSSAKRIISAS